MLTLVFPTEKMTEPEDKDQQLITQFESKIKLLESENQSLKQKLEMETFHKQRYLEGWDDDTSTSYCEKCDETYDNEELYACYDCRHAVCYLCHNKYDICDVHKIGSYYEGLEDYVIDPYRNHIRKYGKK